MTNAVQLTNDQCDAIAAGDSVMTKKELYDMILDDFIYGSVDVDDTQTMIKDLIMLLEPEAVHNFAEKWGYLDMRETSIEQ